MLGIETSCDETSAAIVNGSLRVRSNIVASQIQEHERFGGVVPEIASRQHILTITPVCSRALHDANTSWDMLEGVAVTRGPGLAGPLLVGINFAKGLSLARGIPLYAVDHVEAHILSVWLDPDAGRPQLPMVTLVVSGGHTELVLVDAPGRYRLLGRTVDDAVGEAFDKVGRLLGLPYPGGPSVEKVAGTARDATPLPRAWLPNTYDFSFSGLKTAVLRLVQGHAKLVTDQGPDKAHSLPSETVASIAAGFQISVCDVLTKKLAGAVKDYGALSAAIVGGVANNQFLRSMALDRLNVPLLAPGFGLSTDNAAMIAGAALLNPHSVGLGLDAAPSLSLDAG